MRPHEQELNRQTFLLLKKQAFRLGKQFRENGYLLDPDINAINDELKRVLIDAMLAVIAEFWRLTEQRIRRMNRKQFETYEQFVLQWAIAHAGAQIVNISNTSRRLANTIIVAGISDNLTQGQIARNLRTHMTAVGRQRSFTIARTEIHKASNYGAIQSARETGVSTLKQWVAKIDERTRACHAAANGQQQELDSPFDVCGEQIMQPGEGSARNAINCRCTVVFVPQE